MMTSNQFGVPKESQDLPAQITNEKSGNSLQQMGEVIVGNNRLKAQDMAAQQNVTLRRFNVSEWKNGNMAETNCM
jgi:subtilisin-like proprotein convertase family protein